MNGYLERLGLTVEDVTAPTTEVGQVVCEPLEINFLAADLMRWKGVESLRDALPDILDWSDQQQPPAKGVFIVDSVYEAKKLAAELRQLYSPEVIGEVHGYMEPTARGGALKRRFSVGTTTIDVGVDLTGPNSKEFLAGESRSAAQAIQRIGRLGRRGREPGEITTPNRVWLVVPDYVYQYLQNHFPHEAPISRYDLFERLKQAYLGNENFQAYTEQYSHLEAVAASERILKQYFKDELPGNKIKLHTLVYKLYSTIPTTDTEEIEKVYNKWRRKQKAVWQKFGRQIKTNFAKNEQFFLSDLESFRGGLESDFSVVLYDELDVQQKMKPIKVYNLPFVLRRTECQELTQLQFQDLIRKNHPLQADEWLGELEQKEQRLGYFKVTGLINGPAIEVYFEIAKRKIEDYFEQNGSFRSIMRLSGFTINDGDSRFLQGKTSFHGKLQKLELNCWISEQKSFKLSQALHLPPLFTIYPLHARSIGGKYDDWSVAFGLDAFMMGSIRSRQMSRSKNAGGAYII